MDPHSFIARAEAQRWLGIAEKLLISHDLVGSKTFAIRARESDPRLEAADQILAIADTLLAAEKRVVGTNGAHQPDYYAILQLVRFVQDTDHIASQFRRLAVAVNPHHNRFPYADQAFQLVNDAWAVLSNPMRKSMYDSDLDYPSQQQMNTLGFNIEQQQQQQHQQQQHHQQHQHQQQQQQPHNFFSINHVGGSHEQSHQHQSHQHQHQQLQQHNFLPQVQPFQVNSPPHQQTRPSPQPQGHIQSPPATPQHPFSWPQASQMTQQLQHHQIKQEQQHHQQLKQEQHMQQHLKQEQQIKQQQLHQEQLKQQQMQQEQLKQQKLQQEQLKQQQLQEEQRTQQQMMEEQRKQQQLMEEQRKQQQLQEEQRRQQQMLEEQRKQQQMLEEQRKQQQMLEEQRKQQQLLEEQRKQQQLLEEQRKQQQLLEEQRKQQQLLEEQRKQQQLLEEQRKQQQLLEEQRKQQQLLEEQRKQQQLLEEQRKQQQLLEEQQKQQKLLEEQRKQQQLLEEQRKQQQLEEEQRKQQQLEEEQRKQQQLQEEQRKQQQLQEEQQKQQEQQQQESVKYNATPVQHPSWVNSNNVVRDEETEPEPVDDSPTFWTACPFCFYMYEYPKVYVECTLRCDNCKRAYQAVRISSPPPIIEGQDAYFYCWGFFPIGVSMSDMQQSNNKVRNSNWTPFSSLHNASNNVQNHLNEQAAPKENPFVNKSSGPRIYFDDITDDVFIGVSEPSSDSDTEWVGTKKQKSKRTDKGFKDRIQVLALRAVYTGNGSVKNLKHGIPVQEGVGVPTVLVVEAGKINVCSNPRKQPSRVAQELGKLDLNVEFNNNEGEETVPRMTAGTRTHEQGEESIEGTEFFEGLDEYLSSLPILSVVNEEKVKAA